LPTHYQLESLPAATILRLTSSDNTNRLTRQCVVALIETVLHLRSSPKPLILAGNPHFFSAGADLAEIAALTGPAALEFSKLGQRLMNAVAVYPAPTYAAIEGYCMGGGLDLALACRHRIASPRAIFGHRGAARGLITGWGGTQRLPRQIGTDRALYMFLAAEKLDAVEAQRIGLVDAVVENPIAEAEKQLSAFSSPHASAT
jgi:enoyl-CoA hydratase